MPDGNRTAPEDASPVGDAPAERPKEAPADLLTGSPAQEPPEGDSLFERIVRLKGKSPKKPTDDAEKEAAAFYYGHLKDQKRLDLGWIGVAIGHGVEKLGNIAFLVILMAFALLVGLMWVPAVSEQVAEKTNAQLFSIITLALGYLFGKTAANRD